MNYSHEPVLLKETLNNLIYDKSGSYLDCTFGLGGHSKKILENKKNNIIAIDRDKDVLTCASKFEKKYSNRNRT